jgi:hypothetical protein
MIGNVTVQAFKASDLQVWRPWQDSNLHLTD